jgi:hypothetical protein
LATPSKFVQNLGDQVIVCQTGLMRLPLGSFKSIHSFKVLSIRQLVIFSSPLVISVRKLVYFKNGRLRHKPVKPIAISARQIGFPPKNRLLMM